MNDSELSQLIVVKCGCTINEIRSELYQECIPHKQGNFIQ